MIGSSTHLHNLMANAEWLAHRYDPGHDALHLRLVPRDRHSAVPFLTDDCLGIADEPLILRRIDALTASPEPGPIHFLFHSAYCCSTLLAAAFNIPGTSMGLKEPVLLNDLIGWRHQGPKGSDVARVLDEGLRLLARPFGPGEAIVLKPSNVVNPLIPSIMAMRPDAKALFLYAPLETYLTSIARKGMWGRLWVRDLFGKLIREGMIAPLGIAPDQYLGMTDIQVAAVGWLAQHWQFQSLAQKLGSRVVSLNSEEFIAQQTDSLAALGKLFDLDLNAAAIAAGPVFRKDAKSGASFGRGQRASEAQRGASVHGEEIDKVCKWAGAIAEQIGLAMQLPGSLLN